jgi:hypothetical protein
MQTVRYRVRQLPKRNGDLVLKNLDRVMRELRMAYVEGSKQVYISVFGNTKTDINYFIQCLTNDGYDAKYTVITHYSITEPYILVRF